MNFQTAKFEGSFGTPSQLTESTLPEIAFSGRSNVGKSSLLNCLLNRRSLARVSSTPGKTITVNFYRLDTVRFVDLPGYGYAKRPRGEQERFSALVENYFTSGRSIALVVQLVDMRHEPSEDDRGMLEFLESSGLNYTVVLTKSDKLNKTDFASRLEYYKKLLLGTRAGEPVPFSALSGDGTEILKNRIALAERSI